MASHQQWQELIDGFVTEMRRRAGVDEDFELTLPNPGASEADLDAAERRLGHRLDPDHRALLKVADGWDGLNWCDLLGTADLGQGERSSRSLEAAEQWFTESAGEFAQSLGIDDNWRACLPVIHDPYSYRGHAFILTAGGEPGHRRAGSTFVLGDDPTKLWPDLYCLLAEELTHTRRQVEDEVRGPFNAPWDRNVRTNPPGLSEILDKIDEQLHAIGMVHATRYPPASLDELDTAERTLGRLLHPEHRALLQLTDGLDLPHFGQTLLDQGIMPTTRILSTPEIANTEGWQQLFETAAEHDQAALDHHRESGVSLPPELYSEPVAARIGRIPATPFAVLICPYEVFGYQGVAYHLYGVDQRDGKVRNLLQDAEPPGPGYLPDRALTVRSHLLQYCEQLWIMRRDTTPTTHYR